MNRKHEWCRNTGEQEIRDLVTMPVACTAPPSPRKGRVNKFEILILCSIAKRREIGDQSYVPEQERDRRISRNRKDVPNKRAAKLRPDAHRVRVREQPVCSEPRTSCV